MVSTDWDIEIRDAVPGLSMRGMTATCRRPNCRYTVITSIFEEDDVDAVVRDHDLQHAPGRAVDIGVSWSIEAECSVCPPFEGEIVHDADGLACTKCGTTWTIDGTVGTLAED